MDVIGIDPSMTATGIAWDGGALTVSDRKIVGDDRLVALYVAVFSRVKTARLAVIEDLPTHAHGAGITGMAQGVVRMALRRAQVPYAVVPAATLKKYATGKGNAKKPDMRMAYFQRVGQDVQDDNQVDAAWLRIMGLDWLGEAPVKMPAVNREALAKCKWPVMPTAATSRAELAAALGG